MTKGWLVDDELITGDYKKPALVGFKPLSNIWGFKWILASGYLFHSHGIDGPFIVDFPIDSMVIFHSLYFYQRVHAV